MNYPLAFLPVGYALTVLLEAPILMAGLSPHHSWRRRLFAGFWLTACTYPIVILVMPALFESRTVYLWAAETFAPLAECLLFYWMLPERRSWRDAAVIVAANLASFLAGEWIFRS
jgi:hypothetical protein